jgi:hypothetical protein
MIFNITGDQENILFNDKKHLSSSHFNFKNGLKIAGKKAFIDLRNHELQFLNVDLEFSVV